MDRYVSAGDESETRIITQCSLAKSRRLVILPSMLQEHRPRPASVPDGITRRKFLAASSATLLAGAIGPVKSAAAESSPPGPKLALNGGEKTVKQAPKLPLRWGEPERERLNAMLAQDS